MEPVVAVAPAVENNMYKIPESALKLLKAIDAADEDDVYSANIINGTIVVVCDTFLDDKLVSINGKCAKACATDKKLNRELFNASHHAEDKPLDVRSVFIMRDSREDKQQQKQNGMDVLATYKFECDNGDSHSMVVVDKGDLKDYEKDNVMEHIKSEVCQITHISGIEDAVKAAAKEAAKEGIFYGAKELFGALAENNKILADDVKRLNDLMMGAFEYKAEQ